MNKKQRAIIAARNLLRSQEEAILSTHSLSKSGYPFGSVTTFIADEIGEPIIYISDLAQHTQNIHGNPKVSVIINKTGKKDINTGARLTLLGDAKPIDESEFEHISQAFWSRFPSSEGYQNTHDFEFFRIHVKHLRYIGGFGKIHWLPVDQFMLEKIDWSVDSAIEHMNQDHVAAMQAIVCDKIGSTPDSPKMTHIYQDGCVIQIDGYKNLFFPFAELVQTPEQIRQQLVTMTQKAKSA